MRRILLLHVRLWHEADIMPTMLQCQLMTKADIFALGSC